MAGSEAEATQSSREIRAQALVDRALAGDIAKIGSYRLRDREREQLFTVPDILVENSDAEPGGDLDLYADLRHGVAIVDLSGNLQNEHC